MANSVECLSIITDEEFNFYHTIDRELFTRLIFTLGVDPALALHVVALFIWMEKTSGVMMIKRMLDIQPSLLKQIVLETALCLRCAEDGSFYSHCAASSVTIRFLPEFINDLRLGLSFFYSNRIIVNKRVSETIKTVCERAFRDIVGAFVARGGGVAPGQSSEVAESSRMGERINEVGVGSGSGSGSVLEMLPMPQQPVVSRQGASVLLPAPPIIQVATQVPVGHNIPLDDRMILLTFSRGHPVSEAEVIGFFRRNFGNFIEDFYMQNVGRGEQVLYALMVVKSASLIVAGISEEWRAKYSINGKPVMARKYVKKEQNPSDGNPSDGEPSSSQQANAPTG